MTAQTMVRANEMVRTAGDNPMLRSAAVAGMVALVLWATILATLDVVQYDFLVSVGSNPWLTAPASENSDGPYGWLYMASDFVFGALVVALAIGLWRVLPRSKAAWIGATSLFIFGAAFMAGSAQCECVPNAAQTWQGTVHNIASEVLLLATIPMSLFVGLGTRKTKGWRAYSLYAMATGALALPLFVTANALPAVFSWFYLWLLCIPLAFVEISAIRLWKEAQRHLTDEQRIAG